MLLIIITGNDDFIGFLQESHNNKMIMMMVASAIEQDKLALSIRASGAALQLRSSPLLVALTNSRIFTVVGAMKRNCYFFCLLLLHPIIPPMTTAFQSH